MQLQVWTWTETNWALILLLIVGSGVLAWLGDVIGMKFGKRRVSLFGLRPKTAGHVITGLTGVAIAVLTVVILASFSESVRTALFSLKYIQRQLTESRVNLLKSQEEAQTATMELETSRSELAKLRLDTEMLTFSLNTLKNDKQLLENEKNNLEGNVEILKREADEMSRMLEQMQEGTIVIRYREVMAQDIIPPHSSPGAVSQILENARQHAVQNVAERFATIPEGVTVTIDKKSIADVLLAAVDSEERKFVRLSASQNITSGSNVELVAQTWNSYPIYDKDEVIYRRIADTDKEDFHAEEFMQQFLRELRFRAIRSGVAPDPVTNNVGALEGQKFFEVVENLKERKMPVIVNGIAERDIHTEGPVVIKILIEE